MSFGDLLNKVCTIQVRTQSQGAGGEQASTWIDFQTNVKCRLDQAKGQEIPTDAGQMVKATHVLFINNTTVNEKDYRIKIVNDIYNILLVSDGGGHEHHLELMLQRVF